MCGKVPIFLLPNFVWTKVCSSGMTSWWRSNSFLNRSWRKTMSRRSGSVGTNLISHFWLFWFSSKVTDKLQHSKSSSLQFEVLMLNELIFKDSVSILRSLNANSSIHSLLISLMLLGIMINAFLNDDWNKRRHKKATHELFYCNRNLRVTRALAYVLRNQKDIMNQTVIFISFYVHFLFEIPLPF